VTTVWPRRWTAGKTLYIVTRYSSIAAIFLSGLSELTNPNLWQNLLTLFNPLASFRTFLELEMGVSPMTELWIIPDTYSLMGA
jgi:hypothetical protein